MGDGVLPSCIDLKNLLLYIHLLKGRDQVGGLQDRGSAGDDGVVRDDLVLGRVVDGVDPGSVADGLLPRHGREESRLDTAVHRLVVGYDVPFGISG